MINFKNYLVSATAAALIASAALSVGNFTAKAAEETAVTTSATETTKSLVAYNAYSDEAATTVSKSMASNMDFTSKVEKTTDGKIYAYVTLKNATMWAAMRTEVNGEMKDVETISTDATANTKVVKFEIPAIDKSLKTNIEINAGSYGIMKHTIYLKFDEAAAIEKTAVTYNAYSDAAALLPSKGMSSNMDFNAQVEKATDGKYYAYVTLLNTQYWTGLKTEVNGEMKEVETISEDATAKTKVVKFEVPALGNAIKSAVSVIAGPMGVMTHTVYVKFDVLPTLTAVVEVPETKPETTTPETTTTTPVVKPTTVVSTTKYNYSLVTKSKKAKSAANSYMSKPLKVEKTQAGKYYATVTLKNASMWKSVKTDVNGKMTAVKTVSTNKTKNTKVVKFQVKSAKAATKVTFTLNTKVKVNKKAIAGKYTNYIKVGTKYVKPATVTTTSTKKYNFSVLTDDKSGVSATDSYMVKPATITKLSNGKYYATLTIKNADLWKSFKTEVNGKMVEVTTVSANKDKNTKVVKFEVASEKAQVKTSVHIKFDNYDNKYTNYLKLGSEVKK